MPLMQGKYTILTVTLAIASSPNIAKTIDAYLEEHLGLTHQELDPEEFYDISIFVDCMAIYCQSFPDPTKAVIELGKRIYPTNKWTGALPDHLKTPLDFIVFEAEGFKNAFSSDVVQRKIMETTERSVTMYAPSPGYVKEMMIGVWLGILEMIDINSGKVEEIDIDTWRISW